jgi:ABC-type Mn2+/Zn2+ transport system permease subunit
MIEDFLSSWGLFRDTYLAGWFLAIELSLSGVFVVARGQIFLGAALSQASLLGITVGLLLTGTDEPHDGHFFETSLGSATLAVTFSVIAALWASKGPSTRRTSSEAMNGYIWLFASSVGLILVSQSPHGPEELQAVAFSSLIGATSADVVIFAVAAALLAIFVGLRQRAVVLFLLDPAFARAVGLNVGVWQLGLGLWLGVSIGLAIRVAGLLFTFGCLVLPALIAQSTCSRLAPQLVVAPIVGVLVSVASSVVAHELDLPSGQVTVALFCAVVAIIWTVRLIVRKSTGRA